MSRYTEKKLPPNRAPVSYDERQSWTVDEYCNAFRISRTTLYALIRRGQILSIQMAGRRLIPK